MVVIILILTVLLVFNHILHHLASFDFYCGSNAVHTVSVLVASPWPYMFRHGMPGIAQSKRFPNGMLKWHRLYTFQPIWINLENLTNLKNQEFFRLQTKCKQEMFFGCFQGFFMFITKLVLHPKLLILDIWLSIGVDDYKSSSQPKNAGLPIFNTIL